MNVDAQEAALGLLSMGHNYFSQPTPSTSSATLNSILTTTASPVIPQKRKQSAVDQESTHTPNNHVQYIQREQYLHLTHSPPPERSPRSNGAESNDQDGNDTSTEAVDCICGFAVDDGFSIACDKCSRWCHSACFGIAPGGVPDKFICWICQPRSAVEKAKAVRLQRERLGLDPAGDGGERDPKETKHRRRSSPGLDKKPRRATNSTSASTVTDSAGPGKKKRRPSIVQQPPTPTLNQPVLNGGTEEEQVDVDIEPWREAYVQIAQDVIPSDDTRAKLRRQAAHWRGVTAISPETYPNNPVVVPSSSLDTSPLISIKPLEPQMSLNPFLSHNSNPDVLPPAFALHTTQPIPSEALITPFRSCITPSATYLADPLNSYAHLGMPKPYVHLMGPPLDLALDARLVGNQGRFARWGCRPNAILRPVLCERGPKDSDDDTTLAFGVFATRDLKANEEIILGWEWDDGNAVHSLPALLEAPDTFPSASTSSAHRSHEVQHLKNQMSNILHALSSTFTTCACGARSTECALTQMAAFVDGQHIERPRAHDSDDEPDRIDIGPLIGRKRGFRTRERIPFSGGLGGMEMAMGEDEPGGDKDVVWDKKRAYQRSGLPPPVPSFVISPSSPSPSKKGKEKAIVVDGDVEMAESPAVVGTSAVSDKRSVMSINHLSTPLSPYAESNPLSEPRPPDPPDAGGGDAVNFDVPEDRLPPKMRKKWMHRELEALKESVRGENRIGLGITLDPQDEHLLMPPPPMPASMDPTTISSTDVALRSSSTSSLNSLLQNHPLTPQRPLHGFPPSPVPLTSPDSLPDTEAIVKPTSPSRSLSNCPASTSSAITSFANLSLLSPDSNISNICRQPQLSNALPCMVGELVQTTKTDRTICKPVAKSVEQSSLSIAPALTAESEEGELESSMRTDDDSHQPVTFASPSPLADPHNDDYEVDYSPQSPEAYIDCSAPYPVNLHSPSTSTTDTLPKPLELPNSPSHLEKSEAQPTDTLDVESQSNLQTSLMTDDLPSSPSLPSGSATHLTLPVSAGVSPISPTSELEQKPPPKVKLTLKDFALRRKKQREEMAITQASQVSPVIAVPQLPEANGHETMGLETEKTALVNGQDSEGKMDAYTGGGYRPPSSFHDMKDSTGTDLNGAVGSPLAEEPTDSRAKVVSGTVKPLTVTHKNCDEGYRTPWSIQQKHSTRTDLNGAIRSPLAEEPTDSRPKVVSGTVKSLTVTHKDYDEDKMDSSLSPVPPTHNEPVVPVPRFNGHARTSLSPSVMDKPPLLLPAHSIHETSMMITSKPPLREMKQEVIEHSVPSLLERISGIDCERSVSPISPDPASLASRISLPEDGEIGEIFFPSASRTPLPIPSKRDPAFISRPLSRNGPPFSHSPPTGPRNLMHPVTSPSSVRPSSSLPAAPSNGSSSRLAPTAPRALRQSLMQNHRGGSGPPSQVLSIPPPPSSNNMGGSQYIPRGPSADRDRERDRERDRIDWEQRHYRAPPPPPPRRGGSGRGNPWGRS